jgi:hypothetical protein
MRLRALSARSDFEVLEDFLVEVQSFIQLHFVSQMLEQRWKQKCLCKRFPKASL